MEICPSNENLKTCLRSVLEPQARFCQYNLSSARIQNHEVSSLGTSILTCKEASVDVAEGDCQHWPLFSRYLNPCVFSQVPTHATLELGR